MQKQIAQVMNIWVEDWNEKRMDDLTKLYYSHAVLLPADGSRALNRARFEHILRSRLARR